MLAPLGIYVHFPWCLRKCPYCDFNSHQIGDSSDQRSYGQALLNDLRAELAQLPGRPLVGSVFFGGGTPSLMAPSLVAAVLDQLAGRADLTADCEVTLEANPGALDYRRFLAFRRAGVNRLSIGVQSFDDSLLAAIGRVHDAAEAREAVAVARNAGFTRINLDLMYGLPGQTPAQALVDLTSALALQPHHLSWYQLTLEANTPFAAMPPTLPEEESLATMEAQGYALLAEHGFRRYEVSAFALPDQECRHNLNYWRFGDYIGIGAGAHGKISDAEGYCRIAKRRSPGHYQRAVSQRDPVATRVRPAAGERLLEFMMNVLRLPDGVPTEYGRRAGLPECSLLASLRSLIDEGLLEYAPAIRATTRAWPFLDSLLQRYSKGLERLRIG